MLARPCPDESSRSGQDASVANETEMANATEPQVPYLHGRWIVNVRYSEVKGSIGVQSGCKGIWPYIYSIEYDLYQRRGSPEYVLCRQVDETFVHLLLALIISLRVPTRMELGSATSWSVLSLHSKSADRGDLQVQRRLS